MHLFLLAIFAVVGVTQAKHWGVIVAGSNTYMNYRHQADACHAYQILHKNGIPDENIIVFMYDDIAMNPSNPTKGVIINKPNGPDVYKGTLKDYVGVNVTAQKFLKAIVGDTTAGGKVLQSGPDDHVFIFLTDHGAPGFFAFPSTELMATDFVNAIKQMNLKKMYSQMVIYIEACEAGSMFNNLLPNNIKVYGTTASNPTESSYACYYDATRNAYLGDLYSVNWMEDTDAADITKENLNQQFVIVRNKTNLSHVMQYGDASFDTAPIGRFQGQTPDAYTIENELLGLRSNRRLRVSAPKTDAVRSEHVRIATLQRRIEGTNSIQERASLQNELSAALKARELVDTTFHEMVHRVTGSVFEANRIMSTPDNSDIKFECYNPLVPIVRNNCFFLPQDEWASYRMHTLVTLCREGYSSDLIAQTVLDVCKAKVSKQL